MTTTKDLSVRYLKLADLIEKKRIITTLDQLAEFSDHISGSTGVTRLAYSDADLKGKAYIANLMKEAGLDVQVSRVGNIFGRLKGSRCDDKVVMTGSHTDTVHDGGRFDGIVGVVSAIEALRVLAQVKEELVHPIEAVDWAMEEAARFGNCHFGSKVFMGEAIDESTLCLKDRQGITLAEAMQKANQLDQGDALSASTKAVNQSRGNVQKVKAYIELHIEQSGELEEQNLTVGVVKAAAGPTRWAIEIVGKQAHSGSTPMNRRHNALLAAAQFVLAVEQVCQAESVHGTVGTVTKLTVEPNSPPVVPGKCSLFLDFRSTDAASKKRVKAFLEKELQNISAQCKVDSNHQIIMNEEPTLFSPKIMEAIKQSCAALRTPHLILPSRAGHDACTVARKLKDVGMIFVPSRGGVSHHPEEWTDPDHIVSGAKVLLLTLLQLATCR
jgi:hydantoinase/carbamoylase family amidase